jgi:uncharacterized protein (TIGR02646 family)
MLSIPTLPLSAATAETLAGWQAEVDAFPDHARRIGAGKTLWKSHQRETGSVTGPDGEVRRTLQSMCFGIERCMYCEDSVAHQVEHIWPKHHYPDRVFSWPNMLYACHACNGPKTSQFALRLADGSELELGSKRDDPPPAGRALLIDPRIEDPCAFFELDLIDTFWFTLPDSVTGDDRRRAEYTLEILRLNTRAALVKARRQAYGNYRARLREYIEVKRELDAAAAPALLRPRLDALRKDLLRLHHPTVWREMVRQADTLPELRPLFDAAPEARRWRP